MPAGARHNHADANRLNCVPPHRQKGGDHASGSLGGAIGRGCAIQLRRHSRIGGKPRPPLTGMTRNGSLAGAIARPRPVIRRGRNRGQLAARARRHKGRCGDRLLGDRHDAAPAERYSARATGAARGILRTGRQSGTAAGAAVFLPGPALTRAVRGGVPWRPAAVSVPRRVLARAVEVALVRLIAVSVTALAVVAPAQRRGREHIGGRAGQVPLVRLALVAAGQRVLREAAVREPLAANPASSANPSCANPCSANPCSANPCLGNPSGANPSRASSPDVDPSGANLSGVNLSGAKPPSPSLSGAKPSSGWKGLRELAARLTGAPAPYRERPGGRIRIRWRPAN